MCPSHLYSVKEKYVKLHEQIKSNKYVKIIHIKIIHYMYTFPNRINFTLTVHVILRISFTVSPTFL